MTFTFVAIAGGARSASISLSATTGGTVAHAVSAVGVIRLTVVGLGTRTVTSIPAGIDCGATCSAPF